MLLLFLLSLCACSPSTDNLSSLASQQFREGGEKEESWLHDGKLHFSNALEWQKASFQNKRSTASDFLLALGEQGRLSIDISSNKSLKRHSEELVNSLNEQFKIIGPAAENTKKYQSQLVSDAVVLLTSQKGWLQNV